MEAVGLLWDAEEFLELSEQEAKLLNLRLTTCREIRHLRMARAFAGQARGGSEAEVTRRCED